MKNALRINKSQAQPGTQESQTWDLGVPGSADFDVVARYDGRTGELLSWVEVPVSELDSDAAGAAKMTWVRVYKDYLLFALQRRKFGGLVEVMVWLYALANLRNSGVCQINQSKLAKMLGHAGSKTVNRAILSLVAKGVLTAVGSESQGERLYALERGAARVGRIKRG